MCVYIHSHRHIERHRVNLEHMVAETLGLGGVRHANQPGSSRVNPRLTPRSGLTPWFRVTGEPQAGLGD